MVIVEEVEECSEPCEANTEVQGSSQDPVVKEKTEAHEDPDSSQHVRTEGESGKDPVEADDQKEEQAKLAEEAFEKAEELRKKGNEQLSSGDMADAAKTYADGLVALARWGHVDSKRANEFRLAFHLNISLADLRRFNLRSAVEHASAALSIDPKNSKGFYRRGLANLRLSEQPGHSERIKDAKSDFQACLVVDPSNLEAAKQLKSLVSSQKNEQKDLDKAQRTQLQGMFRSDRPIYQEEKPTAAPKPAIRPHGSDHCLLKMSMEDVCFHYEKGVDVLCGVSLELRAGWCLGMVGNNASGKSTVARLLEGQKFKPISGKIWRRGEEAKPAWSNRFLSRKKVSALVAIIAIFAGAVSSVMSWLESPMAVRIMHKMSEADIVIGGVGILGAAVCLGMFLGPRFLSWFCAEVEDEDPAKMKVVVCSSDTADKEDIPTRTKIENVIGDKLPRWMTTDQKKTKVIELLEAGGFQMYNQETGEPVGSASDYIRDGLEYGILSGGQKHLIYVLRCIACEPAVFLCDELLGGLDHIRQPRVLHMLQKLKKECNTSILYISCELHQLRLVADSIAFLDKGIVVDSAPMMDFMDDPKHPASKDYLGYYKTMPGFSRMGGKLAEVFTNIADDAKLAAPWQEMPPRLS